jgi:hypothetical protein
MKFFTLLVFLIITLQQVGCSSKAPLVNQETQQSEMTNKHLGRDIYVAVIRVFDSVEDDIDKADICRKRDAACTTAKSFARQLQWASVHLYDGVVIQKAYVPKGQINVHDIIKIRVSSDPKEPPKFLDMGARQALRSDSCTWIDGLESSMKGGVICRGYSYKSIASK